MNKKTQISLLILLFFAGSCAQVGSLSGGEKDTDSPVLKSSNPSFAGTNFNDNKIILTFNEFFVLDNLNSVFLSSPPLEEKPDFNIKKKSLIIKLHEKLKDSTTYTFLFGDAIKDYHEGNKIIDFKFVFSTGNKIDTLEAGGKLIDAVTHTPQKDFYIMLYEHLGDSVPLKEKPYYIAKTDSAGTFKTDYIKPGKYKIFALKDNDANLIFNLPDEKIAFIDSFIVPEVKTETKIDSLKAGTVLHKGNEDTAGDTLQKDTVIITQKYLYSPQNILLFAFTEDNTDQYLMNAEREKPGKCIFQYSKEIKNMTFSSPEFPLKKDDYYTEKQDTGKTVILWLKNKDVFNKDSLTFISSYFNKDSLGNKKPENDTILLTYNFAKDTLKHQVKLSGTENKEIDLNNPFTFETETPVRIIDTNKIKLFELIDTLVDDPREQKLLNYSRPAPDTLLFQIKRPFAKRFYPKALNFDSIPNWYTPYFSQNNTSLTCVINKKEISEKDTLKINLKYDNHYFRGQIQQFSDTLTLPLLKQKLLTLKRPAPDTLIFEFIKKISSQTEVNPANENKVNWYRKIPSPDNKKLILKITDKYLNEEDTLLLKIRTFDYDNSEGNKIWFEYIKPAVFKFKEQKITKAKRTKKNRFILSFNKPLISDIKITDFRLKDKNAFDINYNNTKDSVKVFILNPELIKNDTLKIGVSYKDKRKHKIIEKSDTLTLIYKKQRRKHTRHKTTNKQSKKTNNSDSKLIGDTITIEIPKSFIIKKDSVNERKLNIFSNYKKGFKYVLKTDSFAFEDYYGNFSEFKKFKFKIRTENDYGNIILNISNIKRISDENFYFQSDSLNIDSAKYSVLKKGQLILKLYDEKNNLVKEEFLKKDTVITYKNIISGTYHLEMIYDINENKQRDTGKYLKHLQPERTFYYPDDIIIKPGWDNEVNIKFNPKKLK